MGTQEFSHNLGNQLRILIDTDVKSPPLLELAAQFRSIGNQVLIHCN